MMRSIRFQIALIISLVVSLATAAIVMSAILFLDDFYVLRKTATIESVFWQMDKVYDGSFDSVKPLGESTAAELGIAFDYGGAPPGDGIRLSHVFSDGAEITTFLYKKNITKMMGTILPFIVITGLIFTGLAVIASLFLGRLVAAPILNIKRVAEEISRLNFNAKYEGVMKNELGDLGNSINDLGRQLEDKINTLENDNLELYRNIEAKDKLDTLRKRLISDISHELRTPVTAISGYSEALLLASNPARQEKYISVINKESMKLSRLIDEILDISRMESGDIAFDESEFNLRDEVSEILSIYDDAVEENAIILSQDVHPVTIIFDKMRLSQILVNFMNNALAHVDDKKTVSVFTTLDDGVVRLCVFNSGNGIDPVYHEAIWDSFFKLDKARSGGNGIGLSVVKGIMRSKGLGYGVRNVEDGIEFHIDLKV